MTTRRKTTPPATPPLELDELELEALARQGHKTARELLALEALTGRGPSAPAAGETGDETGDGF